VNAIRLGALVLGLSLAGAPSARAGWLSNLNPFASKQTADDDSSKRDTSAAAAPLSGALGSSKYDRKVSAGSGQSTTVQQWNGTPIHPVNYTDPAPKPSLLSRIGSAPSNLFKKTKSLFSKSPPPQTMQKRSLGTPSGGNKFTHSGSAATHKPSPVSQFLSQKRPGF
jgi:hypothetical protein